MIGEDVFCNLFGNDNLSSWGFGVFGDVFG